MILIFILKNRGTSAMSRLEKIVFKKKRVINNKNGNIIHFFSKKEKNFKEFGEIYFTWVKKNKTKGWKYHKKMHMNLTVPVGYVRFFFYDDKKHTVKKIDIGKKNHGVLYVPPRVWFAFRNINKKKDSLVTNLSNIIHSKNESINKNLTKFNIKI